MAHSWCHVTAVGTNSEGLPAKAVISPGVRSNASDSARSPLLAFRGKSIIQLTDSDANDPNRSLGTGMCGRPNVHGVCTSFARPRGEGGPTKATAPSDACRMRIARETICGPTWLLVNSDGSADAYEQAGSLPSRFANDGAMPRTRSTWSAERRATVRRPNRFSRTRHCRGDKLRVIGERRDATRGARGAFRGPKGPETKASAGLYLVFDR